MSEDVQIRLESTAVREMYGHKVTNITVYENERPLFAYRLYLDEEAQVAEFEQKVKERCNGTVPPDLHEQLMGLLKPPLPQEAEPEDGGEDPKPYNGQSRPPWDAGGGDLAMATWRGYLAVEKTNDPPTLFAHNTYPAVITSEKKPTIDGDQNKVRGIGILDQNQLRSEIAERTRPYKEDQEGNRTPCFPPATVVSNMMCRVSDYLLPLQRLVFAPIVTARGEVVTLEGYHASSQVYLALANGLAIPEVPTHPTSEQVARALGWYKEMFYNFPFVVDERGISPSFAHAMALVLEQFARELIDGPLPLHVFDAPEPRTGKTLCAVLCCLPFVGNELPVSVLDTNEEEVKKGLLAFLLSGQPFYFLDNVKHRVDSPSFCSVLTAPDVWGTRLLGESKTETRHVRCSWVLTSNNADLDKEILGRSVRTRLDAKMEFPGARDPQSFTHPQVRLWAMGNRGYLIWAALTMIRSWIAAGRKPWVPPAGKVPLASFEEWSYVIGGILQHVGIDGFLDDVLDIYKAKDARSLVWELFVAEWWKRYTTQDVTVAQLYAIAREQEEFDFGRASDDDGKRKSLGRQLRQRTDRIIGGKRIEQGGKTDNHRHYRLCPIDQTPSPGEGVMHSPNLFSAPGQTPQECELDGQGGGNTAKSGPSEGVIGVKLTPSGETPSKVCPAQDGSPGAVAGGENFSGHFSDRAYSNPYNPYNPFSSQSHSEGGPWVRIDTTDWDRWPLRYLMTDAQVREALPRIMAAPVVGFDGETYADPQDVEADLAQWIAGEEKRLADDRATKLAAGKKAGRKTTPTPAERDRARLDFRRAIALDPRRGHLSLVQFAVPGDGVYIVDVKKVDVRLLDPVFTGPQRPLLVGHNLKFDLGFLAMAGIWVPDGSRIFDTMCAELLLDANAAPRNQTKGWYGLQSAARRYCRIELAKEEQTSDWGVARHGQEQLGYARRDAAAVLPLAAVLAGEIARAGMDEVSALEMRALPCAVWTELSGMPVDVEGWLDITAQMKLAMEDAEKALDAYVAQHVDMDSWRARISQSVKDEGVRTAGRINWNASEQIKTAFAVMGVPLKDTTAETLAGLENNELARLILAYRHAETRYSSFGTKVVDAVSPVTGRVHPSLKQLWPTTGRFSCERPNLQQVPRQPQFRRLYRPSDPERCFIAGDYSQVELRFIAVMAPDQAMIEAFKEGRDLHRELMAHVLGKEVAEVTDAERSVGKILNFGLCYFMQAQGVLDACRQYGVPYADLAAAERIRQAYYEKWSGIKAWHDRVDNGKAEDTRTIIGRRRRHVLRTPDKLNSPIQGSAADGLKATMALMYERRHEVPGVVPVITVHDEIVLEAPRASRQQALEWLVRCTKDGMGPLLGEVEPVFEAQARTTWWKEDTL